MISRILEILGVPEYQKPEYLGHDNLILDVNYLGIMVSAYINRHYNMNFYEECLGVSKSVLLNIFKLFHQSHFVKKNSRLSGIEQ